MNFVYKNLLVEKIPFWLYINYLNYRGISKMSFKALVAWAVLVGAIGFSASIGESLAAGPCNPSAQQCI